MAVNGPFGSRGSRRPSCIQKPDESNQNGLWQCRWPAPNGFRRVRPFPPRPSGGGGGSRRRKSVRDGGAHDRLRYGHRARQLCAFATWRFIPFLPALTGDGPSGVGSVVRPWGTWS
jgi:hypothetical protein